MSEAILQKAIDGQRLDAGEALQLFAMKDHLLLGNVASRIARKKSPENVITYIVDRNVNYTNICVTDCAFCAFYRKEQLIPKGSRNLIVAGRSVSSDRLANSGLRVQASCMAMGQAAGVAAALAAVHGTTPMDVPLSEIHTLLSKHGAIVPA